MEKSKRIILSGNPLSTQNCYGQRGKIRYMKKSAKDRKNQYILEAKSQWKGEPIAGDISLDIILYFGDKRKRDIDNFHKLSFDALTGIAYLDDSQIQEAHIIKEYDKENPRIELFIS